MRPFRLSAGSVLKNRNYRLYFLGQIVSMSGTMMQSTVQAWLVYRLSDAASWLGIISLANQLPAFLISPIVGVIVDRYDRRKVLIWVELVAMIQAACLAILVYTDHITLAWLALLSVMLGLVTAFELTTRHTLAADLVDRSELHSALAMNSVTINGSRVIGPALAGLLIHQLGEAGCFLLNALSYVAVIVGLIRMRMIQRQILPQNTQVGVTRRMIQGLDYVQTQPRIKKLFALAILISFVAFPYNVLLPVFAKDQLHGDATTLGWLSGMTGLGAVAGALVLGSRNWTDRLRQILSICVFMVGLSLVILGYSRSLPLSLTAMLMLGFFLMSAFPLVNTAIQQKVSDDMRGRVISLYTMTFLGAMPLGGVVQGWLADRIGAGAITMISGSICVATALGLICFSPRKKLTV